MPRPPSKHGLEKKYKSWRKGKSAASGKSTASRASLKNQLRSQRRLLSKLPSADGPESSATRASIEAKIAELESQISGKAQRQKERKNAEKYHQVRFFDRQKLTRMERTAQRKLEEAKSANDKVGIEKYESELRAIMVDKLYVAHFPHENKYIALFVNGIRVQDDEPTAKKRQMIRDRILSNLKEGKLKSKSWLNIEEVSDVCLKHLPTNEATEKAKKDTMGSSEAGRKQKQASSTLSLSRQKQKHASGALSIDHDDKYGSSETEESKKVVTDAVERKSDAMRANEGSDSESSSSASSSESSESEEEKKHSATKPSSGSDSESSSSSSSSSDSDSSSSDSSDSDNKVAQAANVEAIETHQSESDDDFFVAGEEEAPDAFQRAEQYSVGFHGEKGDKSKGWATQNQRPGQYKRRRERR